MKADDILEAVSALTGVPAETMKGPGRHARTVYARTMVSQLMRKHCVGWTFQNIGEFLHRHHTIIIYDLVRHKVLIQTDAAYRDTFQILLSQTQTKPTPPCKD